MIHRAPAHGLALVLGCFISLASASLLRSAVIVTRLAEPIVMGVDSSTDVPIDLNSDGTNDFLFDKWAFQQLGLDPLTGGAVIVRTEDARVAPLNAGFRIGPTLALEKTHWAGRSAISACAAFPTGVHCVGTFFGLDAYIGVEFPIDGQTHYGWIRLEHFLFAPGGRIIEWAYESTPGVPIYAGLKPVPLKAPVIARPGFLRLEWPAEIGRTYQVQAREQLDAPAWSNLSFALPATSTNIMVDLPMQADAQFFRVIEVE